MAKNQAKRNQEQAWENVRQQQQAREQAMQDHRAGEKNAVAMNTGGGKPLAMPVPVVNQVTDKEREDAMNAYRDGERNAVAIAEGYKSQVREEAKDSYRDGERNAVSIAEEYKARVREEAQQSHREGERDAMDTVREYAEQSHREGERAAQVKQEETTFPLAIKTITVSGGLFGPPVSNISPEDIEDDPPGKEIPPIAKTLVEATGIAVDLFAYITYYEMPKIQEDDYSGTVNLNPFSEWNPTPAPIPYKNPSPSELWWAINNVKIKNNSYENIYVKGVSIAINSDEFEDFVNVYPPFTPLKAIGDFNLVQPDVISGAFSIDNNNLIPPNGEAYIRIEVRSESQRYGVLNIYIKP